VEKGLGVQQHLAMWINGATAKNGTLSESNWRGFAQQVIVLLIARVRCTLQVGGGMVEAIGFALCECSHGSHSIDIMDADFFDESMLVIAFRSQEDGMSVR